MKDPVVYAIPAVYCGEPGCFSMFRMNYTPTLAEGIVTACENKACPMFGKKIRVFPQPIRAEWEEHPLIKGIRKVLRKGARP